MTIAGVSNNTLVIFSDIIITASEGADHDFYQQK
jgi:hypothetical protein